MTRFDDLTDAEVLALTDEQIAYHVDRECAESGAGLLPPDPGLEPKRPEDMKDVTLYEVGSTGLLFADKASALDVIDAIVNKVRFTGRHVSGPSYEQYAERENAEVEIRNKKMYSPSGWDAAKSLVLKYQADKKAWDAASTEYKKIADGRAAAAAWVYERISAVRDEQYQRERTATELARYIALADGDETIGRRFLLKAHPDWEKFLPEVAPQVAS